jgi:predicted RecB family nuclease
MSRSSRWQAGDVSALLEPHLLGAYAAKQCPYRLFREFDPTEPAVPAPPDDALQQLFDDGISFEAEMVARILAIHGADAVAIPGREEADHEGRRNLTDAALAACTPIILGALMRHDVAGRRLGEIDILVATGNTTTGGKAEYRPIDVKSHRCTINLDSPDDFTDPPGTVHDLHGLAQPFGARHAVAGIEPKYREDDSLQLAHYFRLLQAHGHADPDPQAPEVDDESAMSRPRIGRVGDADRSVWGGILGMEGVVAWIDLNLPAFNTLTPQETSGAQDSSITFHRRSHSKKRTALDRYDFEFDFRLRVADTASRRTSRNEPPMVLPVSVAECARCPWDQPCHDDMAAIDDVSLVRPVGYPEWRVHRFMGNATATRLAALDLPTAVAMAAGKPLRLLDARAWAVDATPTLPIASSIWPQLEDLGLCTAADVVALDPATLVYATTPLTGTALVDHIECARSAIAGELVVQPDWDPSVIPRGDVEIDLDLENAEFVYLWGARLSAVPDGWPESRNSYVSFASFEPLDVDGEAQLVADLWTWISKICHRADSEGLSVRIYGYSSNSVEGANLKRIVEGRAIANEVNALLASDVWVDLLPYMRRKYWSNWGYGLKVTAKAAGFEWRDTDPGGFASMRWYRDAVENLEGVDRAATITRILAYNEDDCAATAAVRGATWETV